MKLNWTLLALAAAAAAVSAPAHALVVTGDTTGAPTFNRPDSLTTLSTFATATSYTVLPFTVTVAGSYTFLTTTTGQYDPFTLLYTAFAPTTPLTNLLMFNDDFPVLNFTSSGFTVALTTGTTYRYVVTGFNNLDFGAYTASITGPGNVVPAAIPEPATYLLMGLGLAGIGAAARRLSSRSTA